MRCNKAIIAVAGAGTRRLPITKAIEKCMLPVGNKPIVDYIVDDCIAAGITDITFVVGDDAPQIRTYYGHNQSLEAYLAANNKTALLQTVEALADKASFRFVVQPSDAAYGTSVPIDLALSALALDDTESCLFLYGDNIFYNNDGSSEIAHFLANAKTAEATCAMLTNEVAPSDVHKYGIVATTANEKGEWYSHIVEKPAPGTAPSTLSNAGCFLLSGDMRPFIRKSIAEAPQAEKYFTDALNWYHEAGNPIAVIRATGEYLDCGSVETWLHANNRVVGKAT